MMRYLNTLWMDILRTTTIQRLAVFIFSLTKLSNSVKCMTCTYINIYCLTMATVATIRSIRNNDFSYEILYGQ